MQEKYLLLFRAVLAETLLLHALYAPDAAIGRWWIWIIFLAYTASALALYRLKRWYKFSGLALFCSFGLDIGITSLVLYLTQGFKGDFYVAYFLVILSSCFLEKLSLSFVVGVVACVVYGYFAFPGWTEFHPFYLLRISLLLVTAFFSAYVADTIRRIEGLTAQRYEARLAWMQRLSMVGSAVSALLHEAKTPISTILLSVEQIRELVRRNRNIQEPLDLIAQEAERTVSLFSDFLDFSKPKELELKLLSIHHPLNKALHAVELHIRDREIGLETDLGADDEILGSERHLVQVFTNIMLNAVEAMPFGGRLSVRKRTAGARIELEFTDTGMGMTQDMLDRLFEPFYTTKSEGGHGLGLTVVRWIVEKHAGELAISSKGRDKGTRVLVSFPNPPKN